MPTGQHIELNVKAKLRQSSNTDEAGNLVSKTQLKLQFSLLLEGVADGLSPLQSDPVPGDKQDSVGGALQSFLTSVEDALQNVVGGDNVAADDLTKKTVDSFNNLLDSIAKLFFAPAGSNTHLAPPPSNESTGPVPALPPGGLGSVAASSASTTTPTNEGVTNGPVQSGALPVVSANNTVVNDPARSAEPIPADQAALVPQPTSAEAGVVPSADPNAPAPSAAVPTAQLATRVLLDVRVRFVQSLTQIIRTLSPEQQSAGGSFALSERLTYQSSLSLHLRSTSLLDLKA